TESHRVIEELMILANGRVADHLAGRRLPTLYRVHDRPDPAAVERLLDQLASLDVPTPPAPRNMRPQQAGAVARAASRLVADHVAPRADALPDAGEYCSAVERDAMKIERDADDVCLCFLLEQRLQEEGWETAFDGEIVGIIPSGAFVRFGEEAFEGFIPVRR